MVEYLVVKCGNQGRPSTAKGHVLAAKVRHCGDPGEGGNGVGVADLDGEVVPTVACPGAVTDGLTVAAKGGYVGGCEVVTGKQLQRRLCKDLRHGDIRLTHQIDGV